ncbi:MAG TPA: OmpA family protein [Polyangiaceae bacterium]|jgi:peptidoglycan-associated lipoprotein|nr:OmpA family protein [Polyangiaceae bacterium]
MLTRSTALVALIGLTAGCSSTTERPPAAPSAAEQTTTKTASREKPSDVPSRSQIRISDEIRKKCGLSDDDAYFAFDSANITSRDRTVLGKIAQCFESGPLADRPMKLIGHADPRGEAEYNMVLGGRRADSVAMYMETEGLSARKIASTSRGALDATGTDEASWAKDRRVDMLVGG